MLACCVRCYSKAQGPYDHHDCDGDLLSPRSVHLNQSSLAWVWRECALYIICLPWSSSRDNYVLVPFSREDGSCTAAQHRDG